jgi:hypothetical protein
MKTPFVRILAMVSAVVSSWRSAKIIRAVSCPFLLVLATFMDLRAATTDGSLRMEVITAYNLVVDSNVESPSTNGPSAAHLGVRIYNDGPTALTNVRVNIGKLTNALTSAGTPGIFEPRVNPQGYTGTFALQMPGGPLSRENMPSNISSSPIRSRTIWARVWPDPPR